MAVVSLWVYGGIPVSKGVQKVQRVQKVQKVVDCPSGNDYKVSVTCLPSRLTLAILSDSEGSRHVPKVRHS